MPVSPRSGNPQVPPAAAASLLHRLAAARGQAAVELVALAPVLVVLLAVAWQAVLAGHAVWAVRVAARAAARAHAVGADPRAAARAHVSPGLERSLRVRTADGGDVTVSLRIPVLLPSVPLGRVRAEGHFEPQGAS